MPKAPIASLARAAFVRRLREEVRAGRYRVDLDTLAAAIARRLRLAKERADEQRSSDDET